MRDVHHISAQITRRHHVQGEIQTLAQLPADHRFYGMAGRVASEWSHLEHRLDTIIWAMSGGKNNQIACITAQIPGVPGRCRAIEAMAALAGISPSTRKKVAALRGSSHEVSDLRARIVHDPWYVQPSGSPAQFKTIPFGLKEITDTEIDETIRKIKKLYEKASEIRRLILAELRASREKRA